jgi:hypothetical protein
MNNLPLNIVDEILTFLDNKSYLNFLSTHKKISNIKNFDNVTKLNYLKRKYEHITIDNLCKSKKEDLEGVRYLYEKIGERCTLSAIISSACNGHLNIIEYFLRNLASDIPCTHCENISCK